MSRRVIIAIAVVAVLALAAIGVALGFAFDHHDAGPMGFGHHGFGLQRDFGHSGWFFPGTILIWIGIIGLIVVAALLLSRRETLPAGPGGSAPQWLDDWHRRSHGWPTTTPAVAQASQPQQAPMEQTQVTQPLAAPPTDNIQASASPQASQAAALGSTPAPAAEEPTAPPAQTGTTEVPPETPSAPTDPMDTGGGGTVQ